MSEDNFQKNYSMSTVHKAIQLLRAFTRNEKKLNLTELHKKTGIGKSSLQRLLSTLVHERFLVKDEATKQYSLGMELYFLGNLVEKNDTFLSVAAPIVERLGEETKENISISMIEQNERLCIYHVPSQHELAALTFVGHTSPLYAGASAKLLLAFQDHEFIQRYLDRTDLIKLTEVTIDSKETFQEELQRIRSSGYSISRGERIKGALSISVPLKNRFQEVFAGLTITIPSVREEEFDISHLIQDLLLAATEIQEKLKS